MCLKNDTADVSNAKVMNMLPGQSTTYISNDEAMPHGYDDGEVELLYPIEYLNTLNYAGIPHHELKLKIEEGKNKQDRRRKGEGKGKEEGLANAFQSIDYNGAISLYFLMFQFVVSFIYRVKMDDPNITIEEYIRLEEEKACRRGKVYKWETTTYG
ncbi:DNA helicase [Tanacetum coccineum]